MRRQGEEGVRMPRRGASRRSQPCPHLDLQAPASSPGREYVSLASDARPLLCYGSPRTPTQQLLTCELPPVGFLKELSAVLKDGTPFLKDTRDTFLPA